MYVGHAPLPRAAVAGRDAAGPAASRRPRLAGRAGAEGGRAVGVQRVL